MVFASDPSVVSKEKKVRGQLEKRGDGEGER